MAAVVFGTAIAASPQDLGAMAAYGRNMIRASRLLESGEMESGELEVLAELLLGEGTIAGLQVQLPQADVPEAGSRWALTLISPAVDAQALTRNETLEWGNGQAGAGWAYLTEVDLPEDFQDAALAVEDLTTGSWGAVLVELTDELSAPEAGLVALGGAAPRAARPTSSPSRPAPASKAPPASVPQRGSPPAAVRSPPHPSTQVIKLIPPAARPAVGRVRFRTVLTMEGARSAVFYLDGEKVATDERPPFVATLDLGAQPQARVVKVEVLGYQGLVLGADQITVNLDAQPFAVRILSIDRGAAGDGTRVSAEVSVPPAETLERVEFYANDRLVATLSEPPFEAVVDGDPGPSDFARVVAYLAGGASLEDARLFSEQVASERIDVNLVEVYAIVSDAEGHPVQDLTENAFQLKRGRREIPIERFGLAEEVPLVLGLIIDSSESMDFLMDDTKRAAARFVSQTVLEDDRAFLVDFDSQPRLAQALTGDIGVLVPALGRLQVGGNTAIYDAIIYSMSQFEREPGRRALVLLTDGRDYGSKFSTKRCLQEARRLGVPVYVIAISDAFNRMPGAWMQKKPKKAPPADAFLEGFSRSSGGRLFSIADMSELGDVYETINAELRSQYLLAFSTSEPLSEKELQSVEVAVEGNGLSVRTVVLSR